MREPKSDTETACKVKEPDAFLLALLLLAASCLVSFVALKVIVNELCKADVPSILRTVAPLVLLVMPFVVWRVRPYKVGLYTGIVASLILLWLTPSSREVFQRHLYSIAPGMSVAQVLQIMKPYSEGSFRVPQKGSLAGEGSPDSEWLRHQAASIDRWSRVHPGFLRSANYDTVALYPHPPQFLTFLPFPNVSGVFFSNGRVVRVDY